MRRTPPVAAIEFLPQRFFFVTLRETERLQLRASRASVQQPPTRRSGNRFVLPVIPGVQFVSLDDFATSLALQSSCSETVRFHDFLARFINDARPALSDSRPAPIASATDSNVPRARVYYFYLRQAINHVDAHMIHLICYWRLLYLQLSPREAVAPFEHLPSLFPTTAAQLVAALPRNPVALVATSVPPLPHLLQSLISIEKGLTAALLGSNDSHITTLRHNAAQARALTDASGQIVAATRISTRLLVLHEAVTAADDSTHPTVDAPHSDACSSSTDAQAASTQLASLLQQQGVTLLLRFDAAASRCDTCDWKAFGIDVVDLSLASSAATATITSFTTTADCADRVSQFLNACERANGAIALLSQHSVDALAVFTGCYLMKHMQLSACDAFAWLAWCVGSRSDQRLTYAAQLVLDRMQPQMWHDGDTVRQRQAAAAAAQLETAPASADVDNDDDDNALQPATTTNAQQIRIGSVRLTRDALVGSSSSKADRQHAPMTSAAAMRQQIYTNRALSAAAAAAATLQQSPIKCRPRTQGSSSAVTATLRRPRIPSSYRNGDNSSNSLLRADFAQMHKFLHQSGSNDATAPRTPHSSEVANEAIAPTVLPHIRSESLS